MTVPIMLLVLTTLPDEATAQRIARQLVECGLAACVSIGAPIRSVYRWQDRIEDAAEVPMAIKTAASRYTELEDALRMLHPYEVPEIIALAVDRGLPEYLQWVGDMTENR